MKFAQLFAMVAVVTALRLNDEDEKAKAAALNLPDHKLTPEGDAFLTRVFEKYTSPGRNMSNATERPILI